MSAIFFSRFGTLFRPEFVIISDHLITNIFKANMLPSVYQYPSYLVMPASMNNRVIEEGDILTGIHIPQYSCVWAKSFKFRRMNIDIMLGIIQLQQIIWYVILSILKVLKNNNLCKVII